MLRETMESLLKPEALERLFDEPYYFDRTPECGVVYFSNEAGSYFHKDELKVRVGLKETECMFCFQASFGCKLIVGFFCFVLYSNSSSSLNHHLNSRVG